MSNERSARRGSPALRTALGVLLVCAGYFAAGIVGLIARLPGSGIWTIWPATAVLLAALLLVPARAWWVYILAILPTHLILVPAFQGDVPFPVMLTQYAGNVAHAVISAALLRRVLSDTPRLEGLRDMGVFLLIAAVAVPGAVSLVVAWLFAGVGWVQDPWEAWRARTLSNGIGAMTVVPLILEVAAGGRGGGGWADLRDAPARRAIEFCVLLLGVTLVGSTVLAWESLSLSNHPALLYAPLPFLLWAAVRFGTGGLCLCLLLTAVLSLAGAMSGRGPFVTRSPAENAMALQLFLIAVSIPLLLVAAVVRERERGAAALEESRQQFRTLVESIDGIVWEGDPATLRFTFVSERAERLLGYPRERWLNDPSFWPDRVHPEDRAWAMEFCHKATQEGRAHDFEYRMLAADGRVVWLRDLVVVEMKDGRPFRSRGVMVDITARKRGEEALQTSEERYREVVESQTDLVCRYERDTTLTFVNEAYCRFFARPREELIGRRFVELVPEWARRAVLDRIAGLADHGVAVDFEHEVLLPDGSTGWHHWVDYAIRDARGRVVEFQGIGRDITARRRAEEALRQSEGRFRTLVRDFHVGVMLFGPRLKPLMINPAALELLDLTESDFLAQDPWTMSRGATRGDGVPIVPEEFPVMLAIASREPVRNVVMGLHGGEGEDRRWLLVDAAPQLGPDGEVTQVVCTLSDITELKRAQERLSLLQTITLEMAGAGGLGAALEIVLRRVCEKTGWEFGQAWTPDQAGGAMVCGPAWFRRDDEGLERFRALSLDYRFTPELGLPGRVWASGEAEWVRDVTKDPNFPRADLAGEAALKAALAIPIRTGDEVIAVIEFFLREPRDEDDRLVRVITAVGAQLGLVVEHKRASAAVLEWKNRYEAAVESSNLMLYDWSPGTDSVTYGGDVERIVGYSAPELAGSLSRWLELVHPDDRAAFDREIERVLATEDSFNLTYRVRRKDGRIISVEDRGHFVRDSEGRLLRMVGFLEDVTERQQIEQRNRRLLHDLGERVKELTALHRAARVLQREEATTVRCLREIVALLPPAWQYPEVTAARVRLGDVHCATPDFVETAWMQRAEFTVGEGVRGAIEVAYLEERPLEQEGPFLAEERNLIDSLAEMLRSALARRRAGEALRASYAEIQDLAGRLIRAQEEERSRIARELHDDLSQRLAALSLGLSALKKHVPADRLVEVKRVQDQAADVSSEIRGLSHRLHPGLLRHTGLGPALRSLCAELSGREGHGGTAVRYVGDEELPALESDVALCLYRVAQEALGNAQRHSGAKVASVIVSRTDGVLRMTVCDDGRGFDAASARRSGGMGLVSMEERVRLVHGTIRVDSHPGRGTELRVEVPLRPTALETTPSDPGR